MNTKILLALSTFACLIFMIACNGGEMPEQTVQFPSIKDVPATSWEKLAQKKIYFGHQSVGFNIIDGIKDVIRENPQIKLNIVETSNPADFTDPIFAHSRVGKNVDPKSKVQGIAEFLNNGIGDKADFAALKFCYVDVTANTVVKDVLKHYEDTMEQAEKEYPKTTIIHFTAPLTRSKTTWKTTVKKLMGRQTWEYDDNIKRNEYNESLLKRFKGKEPVFDLAKIESTYPDGIRSSFTKDGKSYYSLVPEYTSDGGHLNEKGRKIVAEQLLIFLANLKK